MGIRVLGPTSVDGGPSLSPRDRVVLATLVAHRGATVAADQIADALWGESAPDSWRKVVQSAIVRLRKALGPDAIATTSGGYRLTVPGDDVDVWRFEDLVDRAHELADLGQLDRAVYALDDALESWRGEPLQDLERWPEGLGEVSRLQELRRLAEERRLEALLALGSHEEAIPIASALTAEEALREHRWELLALALYRSGRQGDALRALSRARSLLRDELGIEPRAEFVALEQAILDQDAALAPPADRLPTASDECPYKGLEAYDANDATVFFGRDRDVAACRSRLAATGALVVSGDSGSGKSSLVRAGLVARLRAEGRAVAVFSPGADPMTSLAATRAAAPEDAVLVVDQAEEMFTLCSDADARGRFVDALTDHADHGVVLALRADHLGATASHAALRQWVESSLYLLGAMSEPQLRDAIEGPAHQAGLRLEPGLVDLLVRDVIGEPGALPLLSHALAETWSRREGRVLTVAGYRDTGGVRGAVARTAERLYEAFGDEHRAMTRSLLLRLVEASDDGEPVRHRLPRSSVTSDALTQQVVDTLLRARLVTAGGDSFEVAHEALARAWPRLREWLDDDREGQRIRRHLTTASEGWLARDRDPAELYRGSRLDAADEWEAAHPGEANTAESAFLVASRQARESDERTHRRVTRRLRTQVAALSLLLVVALVAASLVLVQRDRADDHARAARAATRDAELRGLVSESRGVVGQDRALALLLAAEAYRRTPDANAGDALLGAVLAEPRLQRNFGPTGVAHAGRLTGTRVAVAACDACAVNTDDASATEVTGHGYELSVWNWQTGQREAWPAAPDVGAGRECRGGGAVGLATSPDGEQIAVVTADGLLHLFSGRTLEPRGEPFDSGLERFTFCIAWVTFSPDGRWLAVSNGWSAETGEFTGRTVGLFERGRDGWHAGPLIAGHDIRVNSLAFSRDSSILATGSPAGKDPTDLGLIVLHDVSTGKTVQRIPTNDDAFWLALDWERRRVVAGSFGGDAHVYDLDRPLEPTTIPGISGFHPVYDADWKRIGLSGFDQFQLFDADTLAPVDGSEIERKTGVSGPVVLLPDDQILLSGAAGPMTVWNLESRSVLQTVDPRFELVIPTYRPGVFIAPDYASGSMTILSPDHQTLKNEIRVGAPSSYFGFCSDPGTDRILTVGAGSQDDPGDIVMRRGVPPFDVMSRTSGVVDFTPIICEWRPDAKQVAIGGFDGEVALYQVATRELRRVDARLSAAALSVSYRPDSTELWVTGPIGNSRSAAARITNLDGSPHVTSVIPALQALRFTPDGRFLVAADATTVQMFDADSLKPVSDRIPAATSEIIFLSVSPDSRAAVVSYGEGWMRRVDLRAGRAVGPPMRIGGPGIATFGRDDTTIYTATPDGRATVWDLDPDHVRDAACAMAGRNLTEAEWRRYLSWAGPRRATCAQFPLA